MWVSNIWYAAFPKRNTCKELEVPFLSISCIFIVQRENSVPFVGIYKSLVLPVVLGSWFSSSGEVLTPSLFLQRAGTGAFPPHKPVHEGHPRWVFHLAIVDGVEQAGALRLTGHLLRHLRQRHEAAPKIKDRDLGHGTEPYPRPGTKAWPVCG